MRTCRLINSPREAARFVSLFGFDKATTSFGVSDKQEPWLHLHTFFVKNSGGRYIYLINSFIYFKLINLIKINDFSYEAKIMQFYCAICS